MHNSSQRGVQRPTASTAIGPRSDWPVQFRLNWCIRPTFSPDNDSLLLANHSWTPGSIHTNHTNHTNHTDRTNSSSFGLLSLSYPCGNHHSHDVLYSLVNLGKRKVVNGPDLTFQWDFCLWLTARSSLSRARGMCLFHSLESPTVVGNRCLRIVSSRRPSRGRRDLTLQPYDPGSL